MHWLGGKDAGAQVQNNGQIRSPPEEICTDFGDLLQGIAILMVRREVHSAEEVESIRETYVFAIDTWHHDCT